MAPPPKNLLGENKSELQVVLTSLWPSFAKGVWLTLLITLAGLVAGPAYMMSLYSHAVPARSMSTLETLTLLMIGAYVFSELLDWVKDKMSHEVSLKIDAKLGDRVFTAMFTAYQRGFPVGNGQPLTDLKALRDFVSGPVLQSFMFLPVLPVLLLVTFALHWVFGLIVLGVAILQIILTFASRNATGAKLMKANRAAMGAQQYADGTMRNAQVVEAMGMQANIYRRWIDKQKEFLFEQADASDKAGTYQAAIKCLQLILGSAMIGSAAALQLSGMIEGDAASRGIGASIIAGKLVAPFAAIVNNWRGVIGVREAYTRLEKLLNEFPAPEKSLKLPTPRGILNVEQILVAAPGTQVPIIKGVAFGLQPGEVLAVVGPSASGKTSLARALVGLWPTGGGKVRLDGADVHAWDKQMLGPYLGYLPQDVELFEGTLAENIARFGDVDLAKVEEAARAVALHDFAQGLPQGYETPIGGEGERLSGGQRQRVALARALYGNPVLVVLDEPNSSLDEEGDAALSSAIALMKQRGTTFVVITHRTSILGVTDKMLVLRDGYQHAFGPRDEVLTALRNPPAAKPQPVPAAAQLGAA